MNPAEKVRAVMHDLGAHSYDLIWQTTTAGKPYDFKLTFGDLTFRGSSARAIIRAVKRRLLK